jgi:hypothetical protein
MLRRGRSRTLPAMRRLLGLVATISVLAGGSAVAAPAPTPLPAPAQGINVTPDPDSTRKSDAGTIAELGTVQPGQPVHEAVLVRSSFDEPREVLLYAADAQPAVGGGFGFRTRDETQQQVGRWLKLAQSRVTVPPDGAVRVPYSLTVPPGTTGGEYVGAVVAEPADAGTGGGVGSRTRFAMAVYLDVPGGAPGATPGRGRPDGALVLVALDPRYQDGQACPRVRYRNDSPQIIDPVATVTTDGALGGATYRQERVGALLPDSSAEVQLPCLRRPVGSGHLGVVLESPRGGGRAVSGYTWLPWPFVLSVLLLLLLGGAVTVTGLRDVRRRGRLGHPNAPAA